MNVLLAKTGCRSRRLVLRAISRVVCNIPDEKRTGTACSLIAPGTLLVTACCIEQSTTRAIEGPTCQRSPNASPTNHWYSSSP